MALWHTIRIDRVKISGEEKQIKSDTALHALTFTPDDQENAVFEIDVQIFTGRKIKKKGWIFTSEGDELDKYKGSLDFSDVSIEILSDVEGTEVVRNAGTSALAGAVIAGPLGAAAGGWLGSKAKNIQLKCEIPQLEMSFLGSVSSGFIEDYKKTTERIALNEEF